MPEQADTLSRHLPPFAALRAFDAVARKGGIRKAAESLGLDHTVVSRHLRSLEEWLGVTLALRTGNRLVLTESGKRYHVRISAALNEIAEATGEFVRGNPDQPLRLSCVPGYLAQWLARRIAQFEGSHPECHIDLRPADNIPDLAAMEADADIRYYKDGVQPIPTGRRLKSAVLARPELMPLARPEIADRLNRLTRPQDLLNEHLLHDEDQVAWGIWLARNGVSVPEKLPGVMCWQGHLAVTSARYGRGIAVASEFLAGEELKSGALVEVRIPGTRRVAVGSYVLIARDDVWSGPAIAACRHFMR